MIIYTVSCESYLYEGFGIVGVFGDKARALQAYDDVEHKMNKCIETWDTDTGKHLDTIVSYIRDE